MTAVEGVELVAAVIVVVCAWSVGRWALEAGIAHHRLARRRRSGTVRRDVVQPRRAPIVRRR